MRTLADVAAETGAEILALELERRSCPVCRPGLRLCGGCVELVRRAVVVAENAR